MTLTMKALLTAGAAAIAAAGGVAQAADEVNVSGSAAAANSLDAPQSRAGARYSSILIGGPFGVGPLTGDVAVQQTYGTARGGFGQLVVGRDHSAAPAFAVTAPTIFRVGLNDLQTGAAGLGDIQAASEFGGYSTKISYLPPANVLGGALGGLQLGVSFSPALRSCGERLCAPGEGFILAPDGTLLTDTASWQDAVEGAVYYEKGVKIGDDRLFVGVGASLVTAREDVQSLSRLYGDYEAYSVGLNLAFRGITLGGAVKTTNAGLAQLDQDGYFAFDAGVTFRTGDDKGDWGFMLGYGQAEATAMGPNPVDPILFRDVQTAQAGVTYFIGRGITVGAAAQFVESAKPAAAGGPQEAATVVIESSIKF